MPNNRWIRTCYTSTDGRKVCGHAGRKGFILPSNKKDTGCSYEARTYDLTETHYADLVSDLKKILDAE